MRISYPQGTYKKARLLRNNTTEAERKLWQYLRHQQLGVRFRRQYPLGEYVADFYSPSQRLVIEVDGSHHYEIKQQVRDRARTDYLNQHNIKVCRFNNHEVLTNIEGVVEKIREVINGNKRQNKVLPPHTHS